MNNVQIIEAGIAVILATGNAWVSIRSISFFNDLR